MVIKKQFSHADEEDVQPPEHHFTHKSLPEDGESSVVSSHEKEKKVTKRVKSGNDQEKRIERQLTEIYENTDGSMPDMTKFQKTKHSRLVRAFFFLLCSCILLGGVALAGVMIIGPRFGFHETGVVLSITGDEKMAVGTEVRYRIRYRNEQTTSLAQSVIRVRYPEGFVFKDSSRPSTNDAHDEWSIGTVAGHDSGYVDIFGTMYGDVGAKQSFRVFFNYVPANFGSEFQKVASMTTELTESPVTLTLDMPRDVVAGTETALTFTVRRNSGYTLPVALTIDPAVFRKTKSDPAADESAPYRWTVPAANDESKIVVHGIFAEAAGDTTTTLRAQLVGWKDEAKTGEPYTFAALSQPVGLLNTALTTQVVVNGSTSDITVQPGEQLNASIAFKNTGSAPLADAQVRIVFDAPSFENKSMLNWAKLDDPENGAVFGEQLSADRRRGSITWTKNQIPALGRLEPGKDVLIDFRLPIKSNEDVPDLTDYPSGAITVTAEIRYTKNNQTELITATPLTLMINSDVTFVVEDTVTVNGQGKDVHTMNWIINNTFHALKDIRVETEVYGDVTWMEELKNVPAGTLEYNAAEKKIVWTVPEMPTSLDVLALQFGMVLNSKNPSQTQLTSKVRFKAKDAITGLEIVKGGDEVLLTSSVP